MNRRFLFWTIAGLAILLVALPLGVAWYFTGQALYPEWQTGGLASCTERRRAGFGEECGDLRRLKRFHFQEVSFVTDRGYEVPAWFIPAAAQPEAPRKTGVLGLPVGKYAAVFVHGGGADRREGYRLAGYFVARGVDYYMPDLVCHGLAACPRPGLSFGAREHHDVVDVFRNLRVRYAGVFVLGTSVGANSVLMALPRMRGATAVVAENPMQSTRRFVLDTPAAPAFFPDWYREFLYALLQWRGEFDGGYGADSALEQMGKSQVPILFAHGTDDRLVPVQHSRALYERYAGPGELEIVTGAKHARLWNHAPAAYEAMLDSFLKAALRRAAQAN